MGELEPKDDRDLQKIGRKNQAKNVALLMEVPELNTALIEAYGDLDHTEPPPVEATTDTSPKVDMSPILQTNHGSTQTLPPPIVMEQLSQTDTPSLPRTTQAATQRAPPLRHYRAKLKAEIA